MQQKKITNFYLILNVSPKADNQEIKKAYIKLAQTYHPDKNRGNKLAEKKFQQINQAWQVLKDSEKRKLFDKNLGEVQRRQKQKKLSKINLFHHISDVLKKPEKPIDLEVPLKISLEDICQSRPKTIHYFRTINGKKIKSSLVVQIPLGVKQGARLRFKGKGEAEGRGKFGDLYVKIAFKPHPLLQQMDSSKDLLLNCPVSFVEAIQKSNLEILSPYGFLTLEITPPLTDKQLLKIKGHGLPKNAKGEKGNLYIKIFIEYPEKNGIKIKNQMKGLSFNQQKVLAKKFESPSFVYPKTLSFQKKIQKLRKKQK